MQQRLILIGKAKEVFNLIRVLAFMESLTWERLDQQNTDWWEIRIKYWRN